MKKTPVLELRLFEFYAKYLWPIHRIFVKHKLNKRCVNCSLSSKAEPLNNEGICSLCLDSNVDTTYSISDEREKELRRELDEVLHRYEQTGHTYDALVLVSGGKDSTLLVHKLLTEYPKLRILTMLVDNGFINSVALANVDTMVKVLNVAHLRVRPDPGVYRYAFAHALTHVGNRGCAQTVDKVDGEIFLDITRNYAAKLKIPLIIPGFSLEQVDRYLHWDSFQNPEHDHTPRHEVGFFTPEELVKPQDMDVWWNPDKYSEEDIPHLVCPFYVWRMHESEVTKAVEELGVVKKSNLSPLVTNHKLVPVCALVDMASLGYLSWEIEFSRMVREGKADRKLWRNIFELIEYSQKTGRFISTSVDEALQQLDLTRKEVGIIH